MKQSRVEHYDHQVSICPTGNDKELYVSWKGHQDRHCYLMAESLEDLDILVTEMGQALNNYRRKKLLKL